MGVDGGVSLVLMSYCNHIGLCHNAKRPGKQRTFPAYINQLEASIMAILRNLVNNKFTVIQNELITDTRISGNAFRVACYLLSRPDGWQVYNKDIQDRLGIKTGQALANYWRELISAGIVHRRQIRGSGNRFSGGFEYAIGGIPEGWDVDCDQSAISEKPSCGKTVLRKTRTLIKTEHSNTEKETETERFCKRGEKAETDLQSPAPHSSKTTSTPPPAKSACRRAGLGMIPTSTYPNTVAALQALKVIAATGDYTASIRLTVAADQLQTVEANLASLNEVGYAIGDVLEAMLRARALTRQDVNLAFLAGVGLKLGGQSFGDWWVNSDANDLG